MLNMYEQMAPPADYQPENGYQPQSNESYVIDEDSAPGGKFFSLKVHGKNAAFEIKADRTKAGIYTVRIEAAIARGHKNFDWQNKILLQITKNDLPNLIMVTQFLTPVAEFKHYGAGNDKFAKLSYQFGNYGPQLFVEVTQKGKPKCVLPIPANDVVMIGHLALTQYIKNFDGLSSEAALLSFKRLAQLVNKK